MPGADAHRLVQSSAQIARDVAAATGSIAIVGHTLDGPSLTDPPSAFFVGVAAIVNDRDGFTATAQDSAPRLDAGYLQQHQFAGST